MKRISQKRNLIVLAKASEQSDMAFYKSVLRSDSPLFEKAIVVMFSTIRQLSDYLNSMDQEYSFSLIIHIGKRTIAPGDDGEEFAGQVERLAFNRKIDFEYTSADGDSHFMGKICHHTQKMADEIFDITSLPLNRMSDLRHGDGRAAPVKEKLDFAILTALDEGENEIFRVNMDVEAPESQFAIKGKFKEREGLDDYREAFLLVKQKQMGMVDAAISAAEIVHDYDPRFLIMGGVCGGRKKKVKMFDVIIPEKVFDFSHGSLEDGEFLGRDLDANLNQNLINFLREPGNKRRIKAGMVQLIDHHTETWRKYIAGVELHFDVMACGPWVVKTEGFIENLSKEKNNLIRGLEMESYSIARMGTYYQRRLDTLVVKSVMDYTDMKKEDELNGLPCKQIAGTISYMCIRAMLPIIREFAASAATTK